VQRVRAPGWQPPEPGTEVVALGALQIIRVGDFHQVGGPPGKIFRLDEMVTLNGFHGIVGTSDFDVRCWTLRQSGSDRWAFFRDLGTLLTHR